jgi:hypothetical protein
LLAGLYFATRAEDVFESDRQSGWQPDRPRGCVVLPLFERPDSLTEEKR